MAQKRATSVGVLRAQNLVAMDQQRYSSSVEKKEESERGFGFAHQSPRLRTAWLGDLRQLRQVAPLPASALQYFSR